MRAETFLELCNQRPRSVRFFLKTKYFHPKRPISIAPKPVLAAIRRTPGLYLDRIPGKAVQEFLTYDPISKWNFWQFYKRLKMCNSELVTVKFIFLFFFNFDLSSASQSASSSLTIEGDVGKYYQALLELPNLEITDQRTHRNVPYRKNRTVLRSKK